MIFSLKKETKKFARDFFQIVEEWRFIALILDRLFLVIFVVASLAGTIALLKAPSTRKYIEPVNPKCYLYYPRINDSEWMSKCGTPDLFNLLSQQSSSFTHI